MGRGLVSVEAALRQSVLLDVRFHDLRGELATTFVDRATVLEIAGGVVRVAQAGDLVRARLRAGTDPSRRRSKRLQDLADAAGLLEDHPGLANDLDDEEREQPGRVR